MEATELKQIATNSREDGKRLYLVATTIYKIWILMIRIVGVLGALTAMGMLFNAMPSNRPNMFGQNEFNYMMGLTSLSVAVVTAIFCALNYVAAVLITHGSKVLVHVLYTNLAVLESNQGSKP